MKLGWLVVAAAACGSKDSGGSAGSGSSAAKPPPPPLQLARCIDAPVQPGMDWGVGGIGHGTGYGIGRSHVGPSTTAGGQPNVQGDLDKAIIRRYVRRNLAHIQFCYEKELVAKPGIHGTISVQFFITPEGKVSTADATGFDPKVATCVADTIKQIEFPKPRGGGGVQVNYPFTFHEAGGGSVANSPPPPPPNQALLNSVPNQGAMLSLLRPVHDKPLEQWTPFARQSHFADAAGTAATDAAVGEVVKSKLPELEKCFATSDATGSMRVMVELDKDRVGAVRAGGFGDPAIEQCVATAVRAGNFAPATQQHEVACDLTRGAAVPWRASIGKDYTLLGATRAGLVIDGQPKPPGDHHIVAERVALVLVEPDATAATIADALKTANDAPAALVAVHGKTAELVGIAPAGSDADTIELTSAAGTTHACRQNKDLGAGTVDSWLASCQPEHCSLRVIAPGFSPMELVVVATTARAAGVDFVALAADPVCTP